MKLEKQTNKKTLGISTFDQIRSPSRKLFSHPEDGSDLTLILLSLLAGN